MTYHRGNYIVFDAAKTFALSSGNWTARAGKAARKLNTLDERDFGEDSLEAWCALKSCMDEVRDALKRSIDAQWRENRIVALGGNAMSEEELVREARREFSRELHPAFISSGYIFSRASWQDAKRFGNLLFELLYTLEE